MNILLRHYMLKGGAPRSTLQYIKILKDMGHKVTVVSADGEQTLREEYKEICDSFIISKNFLNLPSLSNYYNAYKAWCNELDFFKKGNYDLVLCIGDYNCYFYSYFCDCLNIPFVCIIAGGDFTKEGPTFKNWKCENYICFSKENEDVVKSRVKAKNISVISNRISLLNTFDDVEQHYSLVPNVKIILTSRLTNGKIDSVISFVNILEKVANKQMLIELRIAGDGERKDDLIKMVSTLKNPSLKIKVLGLVNDMGVHFKWAHIAAGKGRSVLEPIMMNRIGIVIGDDGSIEFCKRNNIERLYHYNFAGRGNLLCDDPCKTMEGVLKDFAKNNISIEKIYDIAEQLKDLYSSEFLPEKLESFLEKIDRSNGKTKKINTFLRFISYVVLRFKNKYFGGSN